MSKIDVCRKFLDTKHHFEWFIIKYFGENKLTVLTAMAEDGKETELLNELTWVWFTLPDNKFNIVAKPKGWNEFLALIEV